MHVRLCALAVAALSFSTFSAFAQTDFTYQQFQPPTQSGFEVAAPNAHSADFNEDGLADVLIANGSPAGLFLYLSNGSGGLNAPTALPVSSSTNAVAISDFNGDGHLDIAAITTTGSIVLLEGHGDGTFATPITLEPAGSYSSLVEADFDGNNTQDLAAFDPSGNLTLLLNDGKGNFIAKAVKLDTPPSGLLTQSLVVGDFNGDGLPDLAWVETDPNNGSPGTAWSALNTSAGAFSPKNQVGTLSLGLGTLLATDLDLDGKSDLIGWTVQLPEFCCSTYPVSLFYSNGDGTFTSKTLDNVSTNDIGMTDVNGDGVPDILLSSYSGLAVYLGNGNRSFTGQGTYALPGGPDLLALGFYDRTNRSGLVTSNDEPISGSNQGTLYDLTNNNAQQTCQYPASAGVTFCSVTQNGSQVRVRGTARAQIQPVRHIELWANGKKLYQVFSDEFDATLTLPAGTQITAIEVEANGAFRTATSGQSGACAAPSSPGVNVCSPTSGQTTTSPVSVIASGTGVSGTVNHLELWIDGTKTGNYSGSTMNASVTLASGSHSATVIEVDSTGAYIKSNPISFTVGQSGACAAPTSPGVNVCSPTPGETASSPVSVAASGTGASGAVDHLELWIDGTKMGNYSGSTMNASVPLATGSHSATVIEVDSKSAYIKSNPVSFTVN